MRVSRAFILLFPLLAFAQAPVLPSAGIVNTADYTPNICPGTLISVFGFNFSAGLTTAGIPPLPNSLDGVFVELNDGSNTTWTPLPLFFVSPGQINAQFPFAHAGKSVQLRVRNAAGTSAAASVTVQTAAPRLLTKTMDGKGEALLTDGIDYKLVTSAVPARGNEYLTLYLIGLGAVAGNPVAGQPAGNGAALGPLSPVTANVSVAIGGTPARVTWSGLAPGWAGLYQINVQVDPGTPVGQQAVVVSAAGASSQDNVTLSVAESATALGEALITPAGGVVSAGGVQLKIPAGTISTAATVRISRVDAPAPSAYRASNVYVIRGLPAALSGAMQIALPTNEALDPANVLVVTRQLWGAGDFSQPDTPPALPNQPRRSQSSPVAVSDFTVTLPPSTQAAPDQTDTEIEVFFLTNWTNMTCPGGNFSLFYPDADPFNTHIDRLCTWLNEAKQKIESQLSLVFGPGRSRWPFRVLYTSFITRALADKWGEHVPGANGDINYDSIRLNLDPVKKAIDGGQVWENEMRATIGHELLHFVQNAYDTRGPVTVARTPHPDLWYEEAMSTWFEGIMLGQADYISDDVRRVQWPFGFRHGLEYQVPASCSWAFLRIANNALSGNACSDVQEAGYGASLLLRNIAKYKGAKVLSDVMMQVLTERKSAAQTLKALGGDLPGYWTQLGRFLVEGNYNSGEIWPQSVALQDLAKTNGISLIPSASPGLKTLTDTWSAQDLSFRMERIEFSQALPAASSLTLKFAQPDPNVTAYLYRYQNPVPKLVALFTDAYTLYNADQLVAAKAIFLVLVVQNRCRLECTDSLPTSLIFQTNTLLDWIQTTNMVNVNFFGSTEFIDKTTGLSCGAGTVFGYVDMLYSSFPPVYWKGSGFTAAGSGPGSPNPARIMSFATSGMLDSSGNTIATLTFAETSSDGWNYNLTVPGIPIVIPSNGYTEKSTDFSFKLPGSAAAGAQVTLTRGNCIGTWTPSNPARDGVEVLLFKK